MRGLDNSFWISLSTGSGFTSPTVWIKHGGPFIAGQDQYADLNGDGMADMIMRGVDSRFWVSLSTGDGFGPAAVWVQHDGAFIIGQAQYHDLNGDAMADMVLRKVDDSFWVSLSTGSGFTPPAAWLQHGGPFIVGQAQYADLNGDNRADLVYRDVDNDFLVSLATVEDVAASSVPAQPLLYGESFATGDPLGSQAGAQPAEAPRQLQRTELAPVVGEAIDLWAAAGLAATQLDHLEQLQLQIADLPGPQLADARGLNITLDVDAAGHGWFVDPTPQENEEFGLLGDTALMAAADSAARGNVDLLSVLLHEMGHVLGLPDDYSAPGGGDLMSGWLGEGVRRLPSEAELALLLASS